MRRNSCRTWCSLRPTGRRSVRLDARRPPPPTESTRAGDSSRWISRPRSAVVDTEWKGTRSSRKASAGRPRSPQTIEDLDDACRFPRTSPAGDNAVTRSPVQARQERFCSRLRDEPPLNELPPCDVQEAICRRSYSGASMLRVAQVAQRKPAPAELLDKVLAGNRAMHGVFGDPPKLRDDCGRTREKERFHSPAHLVLGVHARRSCGHRSGTGARERLERRMPNISRSFSNCFLRSAASRKCRSNSVSDSASLAAPHNSASSRASLPDVKVNRSSLPANCSPIALRSPSVLSVARLHFATRVTAFRLMQFAACTRRDDKLRLVDTGLFDADGFGLRRRASVQAPKASTTSRSGCRACPQVHLEGSSAGIRSRLGRRRNQPNG